MSYQISTKSATCGGSLFYLSILIWIEIAIEKHFKTFKITSFAWNRYCSNLEMCWFWLKIVGMSHFQTGIWPLCYRLISDTTTLQRFYGPATFYQNHAALEHVLYIRAGMQMQGGAFLKSRHSWSKIVASSSLVLRHPRRNWTACACSLWCEAFAPQTASARVQIPPCVP